MNFKHLLAMTLVAGLALTGCSSKPDAPIEPETEAVTPETETQTAFTGDATLETPYSEESTDVIVTTISYEEGAPVGLMIDVRTENGMKRDLVASGDYDMKNEGLTWSEQMDLLQAHIVENGFDLSKVTLSDEAGHTDAVSGVSIKVGAYLPAIEELMTSVENGTYVAPVVEAAE